jgi:hypothetical protein
MSLIRFTVVVSLALPMSLVGAVACKKQEPAPPVAEAQKPAEPAAAAAPEAASPTAPATPSLSVLNDPCPMPGEDAAACPSRPGAVDPQIMVAHVLIGWQGSLPVKTERTKADALKLATEIAHEARKAGTDFIPLVWKHGQDPGPGVYPVNPETRGRYVPPFTAMAESLGVGQVDVVETGFGYHVMKRVPNDFVAPDKPLEAVMTDACPGDGEDAAACPSKQEPKPTKTKVSHVLIGYAGSLPGTPVTRTKDEAKALAVKLAHDARKKGAKFEDLMKANTQDPGPGTYDVTPDAGLVPTFKQLGLTLGVGQVDVVETPFGYHVMKRVE